MAKKKASKIRTVKNIDPDVILAIGNQIAGHINKELGNPLADYDKLGRARQEGQLSGIAMYQNEIEAHISSPGPAKKKAKKKAAKKTTRPYTRKKKAKKKAKKKITRPYRKMGEGK